MRQSLTGLRLLIIAALVIVTATSTITPLAKADPLSPDEIKATNQYPNWVADACAVAGSADVAAAPDASPINVSGHVMPKANPGDNVKSGDTYKGKASVYGNDPKIGFVDSGDNNIPALDGASNNNPGIAVWNSGTLGGWWKVQAPNGKVGIIQQTDLGPSTSRTVDINAVAARSVFGYKAPDFPTDQGDWTIQYMGKSQPPGAITKDSGGVGDAVSAVGATETPSTACACPGGSSNDASLVGNTKAEQAYNYFIGQGLPPEGAAGIVGNMMAESGDNTEDLDTHAHNDISGTHDGIVQWSTSRWDDLQSHERGKNIYALSTQLDYVWYELSHTYTATLNTLKHATSARDAATAFNNGPPYPAFEASGDTSGNRETNAQTIFAKYGSGGGAGGGGAVSPSGGCASNVSDGQAFILGDYAWPVDITKSEVFSGYPWPCPGNCHHDNTPAFDLTTKKTYAGDDADVVGRSEFAITDGVIDNLHIYNGISGCYSFHIKGGDGYDYYYTHTRNPAVHEGQQVKVGDKVSEVGERKCTGNGSYPHLHIDRGYPKGHGGGEECCRDSDLVPIINKLYEHLSN